MMILPEVGKVIVLSGFPSVRGPALFGVLVIVADLECGSLSYVGIFSPTATILELIDRV